MRKLASVQIIEEINSIPDADKIEVARVLGWNVVIKKGDYSVGDKIIFIEVDSFLPLREEWVFLERHGIKTLIVNGHEQKGLRLKTIRLRQQISQGLIMPLSMLNGEYEVGDEVTELLKIVKYERPIPANLAGKARGNFPSIIPKTDETRIQSIPKTLNIEGINYSATEKLDGSSITVYLDDDKELRVCSRNMEWKDEDGNSFWDAVKKTKIKEALLADDGCYAVQGELVGEGIQKNRLMLPRRNIYLFNVLNIKKNEYLSPSKFKEYCEKHNLLTVPQLDLDVNNKTIDELVELSKRNSMLNSNVKAEGIVIRGEEKYYNKRISFKVINPEFLLKHKI